MAKITISLTRAPGSGRFTIRVDYCSDDDAMPHEHEIQHRRVVAELLPTLEFTESWDAPIRVERERPAQEPVVG
jgi:hypothetical protein